MIHIYLNGLLLPQGGESGYRAAIHETVPNIKVLDDIAVQGELGGECATGASGDGVDGESLNSHSSLFALSEAGLGKDWHILQQSIKHGGQVAGELDILKHATL